MTHKFDGDDIIRMIRAGEFRAVESLYEQHREAFFRWAARRFDANHHDFEDAWQDAVLAFYTQVASGRLTALQSTARAWLFAVGYRRLLNNNRKLKRILWKDSVDELFLHDTSLLDHYDVQTGDDKKEMLRSAMTFMSNQCRELLAQRYFMGRSIEDIRQEWEHNSVNTTSATLSRCLNRLKELIKTARTTAA